MGMTITEKIMARQSGRDKGQPGELVWVDVQSVMTMDYLGKTCFDKFRSLGTTEVFDKNKVICVSDHLVPPPNQKFATMLNEWRQVVKEHDITHFYDLGRQGIAHQIMVEQGHVLPGTISIGTDSHANTYGAAGAVGNAVGVTDAAVAMATGKAWFRIPSSVKFNITGEWQPWVMAKDLSLHIMGMMHWNGHLIYKTLEFTGPAIESLDTKGEWEYVKSDEDATYEAVYEINVSNLVPTVALPDKLDDTVTVDKLIGTKFNKAFVGTCTNGRLEDLGMLAKILKGKQIHRDVNMIVVPASQTVYLDALRAGYLETLIEAGAAVDTPSCAACAGIHTGVAGDGDIVLSAGNRNMKGRMGSKNAQIYLTSPAVVAASAIKGEISDPRELS